MSDIAIETPNANPPIRRSHSMEDQLTVNKLMNLFYQARQFRKPIVSQWKRNYRILGNRTWGGMRLDWMPSSDIPEILPILASRVGWMSDQRPELQVIPAIQPHSALANFYSEIGWNLQTVLSSLWVNENFNQQISLALWDGDIYGTGFFKTVWDGTAAGGAGNPVMTRVDPFTLYIDPQATQLEDANYIIEARNISLQELDRRFPGAADYLEDRAYMIDVDEAPNSMADRSADVPHANPGPIPPNTSNSYGRPGMSRFSMMDVEDKGITLFECWIREHSYEKDEGGDDVYDSWRVIVMAGNRILLNETADSLWGHGNHPYSRYCPMDTGELYPMSLVQMLTPSQISINRMLTALQLNVELTGNPILIESVRSQLNKTKIPNRPGTRLMSKDPNGGVNWLEPPKPNPMMMELVRFHLTEMERLSGVTALVRGTIPEGRNAEGALDAIQDAAFVRIREALRNLEYALRTQGKMQASLIAEFYDAPRMVSAVGQTGENTSTFLKARHFYVPGPDGEVPLEFDLIVNVGSDSATSASARRRDAIQLFAMGALDAQAVLEIFNWPNRAEIIKRIQMAQAMGQQTAPGARQRAQRTS